MTTSNSGDRFDPTPETAPIQGGTAGDARPAPAPEQAPQPAAPGQPSQAEAAEHAPAARQGRLRRGLDRVRRTPRRAALLGAAAVLALVLTGLGGFAVGAATDDRAGAGHRGEHGPAEPGERDDRGGGRGGR